MSNENVIGKPSAGPWSFEMVRHAPIQKEFGCYLLLDSQKNNVALISSWMDSPNTSEEAEANARLICAAPDLLEALEAAIECCMVPTSSAKDGGAVRYARQVIVADMIRDAIAKAKGFAQ
jgi:hypothetical protein